MLVSRDLGEIARRFLLHDRRACSYIYKLKSFCELTPAQRAWEEIASCDFYCTTVVRAFVLRGRAFFWIYRLVSLLRAYVLRGRRTRGHSCRALL